MAKVYAFIAATAVLVLVAAGSSIAGTFPPYPPGHCGAGNCYGTQKDDTMTGTSADEGLHGLGGDDLIRGKGGNDFLFGNGGDDALYGGTGRDTVEGNSGADRVVGGRGADKLRGGEGNDRVVGGKGDDRMRGGKGNDHLDGQDLGAGGIGGSDVLDCGPGFDTFEADFDDTVLPNCEEGSVGGF